MNASVRKGGGCALLLSRVNQKPFINQYASKERTNHQFPLNAILLQSGVSLLWHSRRRRPDLVSWLVPISLLSLCITSQSFKGAVSSQLWNMTRQLGAAGGGGDGEEEKEPILISHVKHISILMDPRQPPDTN